MGLFTRKRDVRHAAMAMGLQDLEHSLEPTAHVPAAHVIADDDEEFVTSAPATIIVDENVAIWTMVFPPGDPTPARIYEATR